MRILLTNDDGIYAPGLKALRKELQKLGGVLVVAPATEQSAVGHSITLLTPLLVQEVLDEEKQLLGWAVEGRPADCVKLALLELLPESPDLIVSGSRSRCDGRSPICRPKHRCFRICAGETPCGSLPRFAGAATCGGRSTLRSDWSSISRVA